MSIDTRGRNAADGLRESLALVDAAQLLGDLHRARRQRNRRNVVLAAAAAVVVAAVSLISVHDLSRPGKAPATHEGDSSLAPCFPQLVKALTCPTDTRWRFTTYPGPRSTVVTSFVVPTSLAEAALGPTATDRSVLALTGRDLSDPTVEVIADVAAVKPKPGHVASGTSPVVVDRSAGTTIESVANWLAERPWVRTSRVTSTTVSGRPAVHLWDVTRVPGGYERSAAAPLISLAAVDGPGLSTVSQSWFGLQLGMHADIYLVALDSGKMAAVFYYGYDPTRFAPAEQLVNSLRIES